MKIVQVAPSYPPNIGGVQHCTREISERLTKKSHEVEIFTSDIGCKKGKLKSSRNLKIHYLKGFEIAHTFIIPSLFFRILKIPKDSIIHLHIAKAFLPEVVYLISKIKKIPYIAHVHLDVKPSGKLGFLLPLYKKLFLERVLKSASEVVVPTKDYVSLISQKYSISKEKISVIPYGINLEEFKPSTSKLHTPVRLLFVGRLAGQKNIPLLIQSFKKAINRGDREIILHLVGDGEERNTIINLIEKEKLKEKIILHGELRGERLRKVYSNSDIFILSSREESFGIVLIEAMASGLPVIASDIPGVRNVVEHNQTGLLVKPTLANFAQAIEEIVNNHNLRKKLIKNGLDRVQNYDWDKIVEKFEQVYRKVLNETN